MAESSRRAAGPTRKGGRSNARFIVAAAEHPPPALAHVADLVTVRFPWGSLLRGCVRLQPRVASGVAGLVAPAGTLELLLAPAGRDRLDGVPTDADDVVAAAARTFRALGIELAASRPATHDDIAASGSTWAKRLLSSRDADRRVMLVRLVRIQVGRRLEVGAIETLADHGRIA